MKSDLKAGEGTFTTKVRRQGGTRIATLPKKVLDEAGIKDGDEVKVMSEGDTVVIRKSDDDHDAFMEAHEYSMKRFSKTYKDLAK
ncbi:MAG: AbrB/MazE/SpoVT family DNA-binding domain-containing protein [Sneathiella sp.]|nr:AbrB/MazE/SpoVT family DNA-binding domain-containing protein [Sneathiella sp.]